MSVHSAYYLRDTGRLGGEMIVVDYEFLKFIKDESELF